MSLLDRAGRPRTRSGRCPVCDTERILTHCDARSIKARATIAAKGSCAWLHCQGCGIDFRPDTGRWTMVAA